MKRKDKLEITTGIDVTSRKKKSCYWWRLRSGWNGKITSSGQSSGYSSRAIAIAGWKSVVKAAGGEGIGNVIVVEL